MESDESSDDLAVAVMSTLLLSKKKKKTVKRRYWVHSYNAINQKHSYYLVAKELNKHPVKFQSFYRMALEIYTTLVFIVGPHITKKDTNFRTALSAEEKLLITLRYLSTGASFRALAFYFMRGETTVGKVVEETTKAIWMHLKKEFMPMPSENVWLAIATRYAELWNIPNCLGSIDAKHIRINAPPKCGFAYFNYKSYHSIVLMAIADADSLFTSISVGDFGRNSDGAVFKTSQIGKLLDENRLSIPPPRQFPHGDGAPFPMFFAADEAFALRKEIMKPYPQRILDNPKRIFNYRLSRARKSVEGAFGILCSKFRIFHTPIACSVDKAEDIVKAACVLHNFVRKHDGMFSTADISTEVLQLRDRLCQYFLKPEIALPWQNKVCV